MTTNLRAGLVAALETALGSTYKVIGYPVALDGISQPTVAVWATDLKHLDAAPNGHFSITYTVQVFTGMQDPARADDVLDGYLEDIIDAIWNTDTYVLESAQRTVSQDNTIHSWTLTVMGGIVITKED